MANKQVQELQTAKTASHSRGFPLTVLDDVYRKGFDRRIQKAVDLLERAPVGCPLRLAEIAATLNISPSHLRHLFKREVGTSPTHYLKLLWLHKAKELLETSFLSVKEILLVVGFKDESHFVRDFKVLYGKTPSQIRIVKPSTRAARNSGQ